MIEVDPEEIIRAARSCLGTPFVHQGRLPGVALDCAGLLVQCFINVCVPYHDEYGYPRYPYRGLIRKILDSQPSLVAVPARRSLRPGRVLLMKIRREPQHVAIYTGESIIHAYSGAQFVVEHQLTAAWRKRIDRGYCIVRG